ncbi:hypothetical protein QCB49_11075 (plasmid) [Cetobacterium somerae]|uniref:hypothetical protein n=1 Tax=Cetobacterium somerae TaxID=188913 RepID=UPI00389259F5
MSKKHRKISLVFIVFLLTLLTVVSFAEPPEAPNQLITENPYKEVKTVEADKNREHAEMNLSVNKIHIKEIEGINLDTGEIVVYLPEEEILKNKIISNETYYVTDSIEKFPDISTVSGKKYFSNSNRFLNKALDNDNNISFEKHTNYISIQKKNDNELYLGRLDIKTGEIKNIWKIVTKTPKSGVAWVKFLPYSKIEVIKDGDEYKLRFGEIARANRTYSASPYDKEENPGFNFNYMLDADFINESNSSYTFKNNIETKTMGKMLYLKTATYHSPVAIDGSFEFRKNNNQFLTPKIKFEELYTATGRISRLGTWYVCRD